MSVSEEESEVLPTCRLCLLPPWRAFAQAGVLHLLLSTFTRQSVLEISFGRCLAALLRGGRGTVFGGGHASAYPLSLLQFLLQALVCFDSPIIPVRKCRTSVRRVSICKNRPKPAVNFCG